MSQPILRCLSLHKVDLLLPVADNILNDTPQCEDDKGGGSLLFLHSIIAPSLP